MYANIICIKAHLSPPPEDLRLERVLVLQSLALSAKKSSSLVERTCEQKKEEDDRILPRKVPAVSMAPIFVLVELLREINARIRFPENFSELLSLATCTSTRVVIMLVTLQVSRCPWLYILQDLWELKSHTPKQKRNSRL